MGSYSDRGHWMLFFFLISDAISLISKLTLSARNAKPLISVTGRTCHSRHTDKNVYRKSGRSEVLVRHEQRTTALRSAVGTCSGSRMPASSPCSPGQHLIFQVISMLWWWWLLLLIFFSFVSQNEDEHEHRTHYTTLPMRRAEGSTHFTEPDLVPF